jgi:hypothetical protein
MVACDLGSLMLSSLGWLDVRSVNQSRPMRELPTLKRMPGITSRSVALAASHVPGIRRIPMLKLLAIAEIGLLAHDHLMHLTPDERRRLIRLVRVAHGRPSNLSQSEREELAELLSKLEPRLLAGEAVGRLSPLPIPRRITHGPRKRR